jgi:DNA-binding CsgD family transcriptional regulator
MHPAATANLRAWLSPADAMLLLEITHECISCRSEADVRRLFERTQELIPFRRAYVMSGYVDARRGIIMTGGINISFPEEFLREYVSRNYLRTDSALKKSFSTHRVQYTSERDPDRPREIISLLADYGLREGYTNGSGPCSSTDSGCVICFKGPSIGYEPRTAAIVEFLAAHLHLAVSGVRQGEAEPEAAAPVVLSGREREVIAWLQEGKSSWDISVILGISESTVNFHVYNVMRKLGAKNRPQALAIAARRGLLRSGGQFM